MTPPTTYTVHALFNGDRHHRVSQHRTLDAAIRAGRAQQRPMLTGLIAPGTIEQQREGGVHGPTR